MPFQKDGVLFAVRKDGRCLIADEMGLGKTLQAIAVASYFQSEWPLLIIVPSSLRYVWIEELEKWLPEILPHEINLIQGGFDTGGIADAKITIVTYGLLSCRSSGPVKEALKTQQFKIAICDESHYFKNSRTECCKAVTPLLTSATRCILLSGTPALAKPSELFTQLDALLPGKFGSFWSFTKKFCGGHWEYFGRRRLWKADGASSLEELQQRLQTVMIRREKNSVLSQLPPKQRQKILFALKDSSTKKETEIVSIFAELKPLLKRSKSSLATNLLGGETTPVASPGPDGSHDAPQPDTNILSRIQQLYNLTGEAKIGPAREYIQMLCENANLKFLVFAYHHAMMDGLQQTLWDKKIKFVRIDGQTKPSDRQLYVQQFQSDKETRVAILSILAAGVGLTLTAASLVVFAELYWTPGMMVQCEDRAHRIGQTSTVPVHYLVARDTMDEWVWSAVCRKTIVTSTALTGRRQALQAEAGDRYQVELLSAADAYTPAEEDAEIDITQLIQSQRPRDQKSILDFFGSQSEPRDCSQSSTAPSTHHGASHIEDTEAGDETSDVLATPTRNNKGKKSFPLFTSLKNTSQSASKHQLSPDPVVIDSSDDEFQNTSGRARLNGVASAEKENNQRKQSVKQMKTGTSRKRKRVVNDPESKSDSEFEGDSSVLSPSVKKKRKKKSGSESLPEAVPSHCKKREGRREQNSRPELEGGNGQPWACSSCTFSNSSLLPFCEICETPRKGKCQANTQKTSSPLNSSFEREDGYTSPCLFDNEEEEEQDTLVMPDDAAEKISSFSSTESSHSCDTRSNVSVIEPGCSDRSKQIPEKLDQSRKRLASCVENGTQESAAERRGRLEDDGASPPCKQQACGHSNDCPTAAAAGDSSTVCGGQRTSSLCDGDKSGPVPHCDSPVLPQAGGEVHSSFMFCCSSYTGRVYLFDKEGGSLKANFLPLDVELDNVSQLPDILHHPLHLRQVQHFVRQWNSLTDTKRRLITKRGLKFHNPLAAYDTVRTDLANNKQRYQTKEDFLFPQEEQARAAMKRAREVKGSVRVLSRREPPSRLCVGEDQSSEPAGDGTDVTTSGQGYVQAMSAEGTPLCIHCQQACSASVVSKDTSASNDMAWSTRFCSRVCADAHWMKTNTAYLRSSVYDVQHGVCQLCGLDAHTFFRQIRDGADRKQRAEKINSSKYCKLAAAQKKQMIARPYEGLFWHVDHIRPVWEGGGQCDMDNLRTLCTPCHLSVTAKQAAKRAQAHRLSKAAFAGDITAFFKKVNVSL
ncbi:hypothetical protein ACOMHN_008310 [Nucella lapillus]